MENPIAFLFGGPCESFATVYFRVMPTEETPITLKILEERTRRTRDNLPPIQMIALGPREFDELRASEPYTRVYRQPHDFTFAGIEITPSHEPGIHFTP